MLSITKELKKNIQKYDSIEERLSLLKDKYVGETAYLISCGPSLNDVDIDVLKSKLKDKLVVCQKQSIDILGADLCDFHIMNTYNVKPTLYDYGKNNTIISYAIAKSYSDEQLSKIVKQKRPFDLYVPIINPPPVEFAELINMCSKLGITSNASFNDDRPDASVSYWTVLKDGWKKENPNRPVFEGK